MAAAADKQWLAFQERILDKALTESESLLREPKNLGVPDEHNEWVSKSRRKQVLSTMIPIYEHHSCMSLGYRLKDKDHVDCLEVVQVFPYQINSRHSQEHLECTASFSIALLTLTSTMLMTLLTLCLKHHSIFLKYYQPSRHTLHNEMRSS